MMVSSSLVNTDLIRSKDRGSPTTMKFWDCIVRDFAKLGAGLDGAGLWTWKSLIVMGIVIEEGSGHSRVDSWYGERPILRALKTL